MCLAVACSAFPAEKILVKKEQIEVSSELKRKELSLKELEEAKSAKYHYSSDVDDGISDLTNQREEKRDGLKVEGFYAYSDGHVRRKVNYIADENGYRIAK